MYRILLTLFLLPGVCFSQAIQDSSLLEASTARAAALYIKEFPNSVLLYTGPYYINYDINKDGFPFFYDEYFTEGSLIFQGKRFDSLNLKYDCHKDILVIDNYSGELELISERIEEFEIYGYRFFWLNDESRYNGKLKKGFYNILYDGEVQVLSKRYKSYFEHAEDRELKKEFLLKDKFYIVRDGEVSPVRNKGSVLRALKDQKSALKRRLRENPVNFKIAFERAVVTAARLYDELKSGR